MNLNSHLSFDVKTKKPTMKSKKKRYKPTNEFKSSSFIQYQEQEANNEVKVIDINQQMNLSPHLSLDIYNKKVIMK
jgi:hypothetical protein